MDFSYCSQGAGLLGAAPPTMGPPGENQDKNEKPPPLMSLHVTAPKEETPREVKLPQALEQALAFKTERAKQVRKTDLSVKDGSMWELKLSYILHLMLFN